VRVNETGPAPLPRSKYVSSASTPDKRRSCF